MLVEHVGPFHAGEHVFREGDPFEAIAAVRAGTVKTYVIDSRRPRARARLLPARRGDRAQRDSKARYPCNAVALDTVMLCRFSFPKIAVLATRMPGLQRQLFRLLSRDIGRAALLAGDWSADQRMAAFLIAPVAPLAARGFSPDRFQLTMARTDIANYLRLAAGNRQPRAAPVPGRRLLRGRPPRDGAARTAGSSKTLAKNCAAQSEPDRRRCMRLT